MKIGFLAVGIVVAILFLAFMLLPYPFYGEGSYNPDTNLATVENEDAYWHEMGHALDDYSGWPSDNHVFYDVVLGYCITFGSNEYTQKLLLFSDDKKELYAKVFELAHGDMNQMPEQFRKFYDWDTVEKLKEKNPVTKFMGETFYDFNLDN